MSMPMEQQLLVHDETTIGEWRLARQTLTMSRAEAEVNRWIAERQREYSRYLGTLLFSQMKKTAHLLSQTEALAVRMTRDGNLL